MVTSPLQRAYDTAAAAAKALGLDVTVDDDLIETDFGAWEGLTFSEAAERDPELHRRWLRDTSLAPPDGESFDSVAQRVERVRNRIIAEHGGATVLVVSHVTPIKTLLRLALDAGPGILYRLHLDLASLSIAEFYPDGVSSVRLVNQTVVSVDAGTHFGCQCCRSGIGVLVEPVRLHRHRRGASIRPA